MSTHLHVQRKSSGLVTRQADDKITSPSEVQRKALRGMSFAEGDQALAPIQQRTGDGPSNEAGVHQAAAHGLSGGGGKLPHLDAIQRSFGAHDVSSVRAHTDDKASAGARAMGAEAFASGSAVAFDGQPGLHTAAHEAAHIVQQRAGVSLSGGVGRSGDRYEQNADAVADAVVQGKSAEPLLSQTVGSASGGQATQHKAVQRYTKQGNARVSDGHNLVVVDGAPHNHAYAPAGDITNGNQALQGSGSNVAMTAGPALNPGDYGLDQNDVTPGLVQVQVSAATPQGGQQQDLDKQNENSIILAHQYEALAKNVLSGLQRGNDPVAQLIDEMENDPNVKPRVYQVYSALTGDYNPANILRHARAKGLEDKYVAVIMDKIIEYQQGIRQEIGAGGVTTPKDCGQVARNFVRGPDVRYHSLNQQEQQAKGYSGHYFAMVLADGTDKVSLENAVGGSKFEQLWKSANFDFMWHFEMRGAQVDQQDQGDEETHGTGESKQAMVRGSDDAQRGVNDVRRNQETQKDRADAELTEYGDNTDKRSWRELAAIRATPQPADVEREKDLLMAGLAYANQHHKENRGGRKGRVRNWKAAVQGVIDRAGHNVALARHVLGRLQAMR